MLTNIKFSLGFLAVYFTVASASVGEVSIEKQFPDLPSPETILPDVFPVNLLFCCKQLRDELEELNTLFATLSTKGDEQQEQILTITENSVTGVKFLSAETALVNHFGPGFVDNAAQGYVITGVRNDNGDAIVDNVYRRIIQKEVGGTWTPVTP